MNRPSIKIHNRQRRLPVNRAQLQSFAERALEFCRRHGTSGLTELAAIDVIVVSDRRMGELHRRFIGIAGPTDVITFQHGEIFLSAETAERQAADYRTSFHYELRLYLVHGLLHLAGYDDRKPAERKRMERLQEKIVAQAAG